ncbi:hypothetical protein SAMN04488020_10973 [Palleronia marisminoris]|uniref:hypothetical protein n=1 Tax=Palleronia marisminoris TaxID=315423 RepID=UPI0008E7064B|nr:hypothetical protein [Palleronia marisminoris]SFH27728.1 hypothetical protein SAMN04488020_10973 [Palleronia marisminoris]
MTTSTPDAPAIDKEAVASGVLETVAYRMQLTPIQIKRAFILSSWVTIEEMIEREFAGAYRGYFPKCSMDLRAEAVIAEVFDQLAIALDDPRRAMRVGEWTPPTPSNGGRSNG